MKIKVIGAGSIGNHLSHAARQLGWTVTLTDRDPAALERTRTEIYPNRYGSWDQEIDLAHIDDVATGGFDLIAIGTPPDSHMSLARRSLAEAPRAVLVEKPLATPDLSGLPELREEAEVRGIPVFVGYDHVVGMAAQRVVDHLSTLHLGHVCTLDVEFREEWSGIFAAHPWLAGPWESYLGFWRRGGGALGEHSHAINLWQFFAHSIRRGRVIDVQAELDYVQRDGCDYDRLAALALRTESGLVGRVVQDVVTKPARKWARIQAERGYVEWHCGHGPGADAVLIELGEGGPKTEKFAKTRPDDFIAELKHIETALSAGSSEQSPLSLTRGIETMLVIAAAHESAQSGRRVRIDYGAPLGARALVA